MEEKDTVLIVDDDPSIRRLLNKVMHSNQLASDTACSAEEALQLLRQRARRNPQLLRQLPANSSTSTC